MNLINRLIFFVILAFVSIIIILETKLTYDWAIVPIAFFLLAIYQWIKLRKGPIR